MGVCSAKLAQRSSSWTIWPDSTDWVWTLGQRVRLGKRWGLGDCAPPPPHGNHGFILYGFDGRVGFTFRSRLWERKSSEEQPLLLLSLSLMPPTLFLSLIIRKTQDHLIQFTKTILNTKTAVSLQYVYIGGKMKSEKKKVSNWWFGILQIPNQPNIFDKNHCLLSFYLTQFAI